MHSLKTVIIALYLMAFPNAGSIPHSLKLFVHLSHIALTILLSMYTCTLGCVNFCTKNYTHESKCFNIFPQNATVLIRISKNT